MHYDWPVKTAIVNLPIRLKGNSEHISDNSLSPLRAQNKDIGAALQMLLTTFKLNLRRRLPCLSYVFTQMTCLGLCQCATAHFKPCCPCHFSVLL